MLLLLGCGQPQDLADPAAPVATEQQPWDDAEALQLLVCGSGGARPDPQRAGSCLAVMAGPHLFLVDVGPGAWRNIAASGLPVQRLAGVLLTHFHADHIGDLGQALVHSWQAGRHKALQVYGPPGVDEVVAGLARAYAWDRSYRVATHGAEALPPAGGRWQARELPLPAAADEDKGPGLRMVFEADGLRISMFRVSHGAAKPAVGYRFDYRGRSIVVSGDSSGGMALVAAASGADLLVHNAVPAPAEDASARARQAAAAHAEPVDALTAARRADVRKLLLTHLPPSGFGDAELSSLLEAGFEDWFGRVQLASDGLRLRLPLDSTAVEHIKPVPAP